MNVEQLRTALTNFAHRIKLYNSFYYAMHIVVIDIFKAHVFFGKNGKTLKLELPSNV